MKNADLREHYNLYYIFKADKEAHPMMLEVAEEMRKNIFEFFFEKLKPFADFIPPE